MPPTNYHRHGVESEPDIEKVVHILDSITASPSDPRNAKRWKTACQSGVLDYLVSRLVSYGSLKPPFTSQVVSTSSAAISYWPIGSWLTLRFSNSLPNGINFCP